MCGLVEAFQAENINMVDSNTVLPRGPVGLTGRFQVQVEIRKSLWS